MNIPQHYLVELQRFGRFEREVLKTTERQVLRLLAVDGLSQKEIAKLIGHSSKSVERLVSCIADKYRTYYFPAEQHALNRRIVNQAAWYYRFAELLTELQEA
jgi:DNA-binding NarL/FixJ family response regulator